MRRENTGLLFFLVGLMPLFIVTCVLAACVHPFTRGLTLQRKKLIRDCSQSVELKVRVSTDIILQYNLA